MGSCPDTDIDPNSPYRDNRKCIENIWRTCILMLGCKGLKCLSKNLRPHGTNIML